MIFLFQVLIILFAAGVDFAKGCEIDLITDADLVKIVNQRLPKTYHCAGYELKIVTPPPYAESIRSPAQWLTILQESTKVWDEAFDARINEVARPLKGEETDVRQVEQLKKSIEQLEEENFSILVQYLKAKGYRVVPINKLQDLSIRRVNENFEFITLEYHHRIPYLLLFPPGQSVDLESSELTIYSSAIESNKVLVDKIANVRLIGRNFLINDRLDFPSIQTSGIGLNSN